MKNKQSISLFYRFQSKNCVEAPSGGGSGEVYGSATASVESTTVVRAQLPHSAPSAHAQPLKHNLIDILCDTTTDFSVN